MNSLKILKKGIKYWTKSCVIVLIISFTLLLPSFAAGECVAHTESNEATGVVLIVNNENPLIGEIINITLDVNSSGCISGGCWVQKYSADEGNWINVKTLREPYSGCPCKCPRGPVKDLYDYNITSYGNFRVFTNIGGELNISFSVPNPATVSLNISSEYAPNSSVNLVTEISNPTNVKIPFCDRVDYLLKSEDGSVILNVTRQHNYTEIPPNSKLEYDFEWEGGVAGRYMLIANACDNSITKEFEVKEIKENENQNMTPIILSMILMAAIGFYVLIRKVKK